MYTCKYYNDMSVASSVEVILQYYFTIFYSTAPNKIAIKLIKLRKQNIKLKFLKRTGQLVIK